MRSGRRPRVFVPLSKPLDFVLTNLVLNHVVRRFLMPAFPIGTDLLLLGFET